MSGARAHHPKGRILLGFTLLEMLAVVALLGLIATTVSMRLVATDQRTRERTALAMILDLDARARLLAQRGQMVELRLDEDHRVVVTLASGECVFARALPIGVEARLLVGSEPGHVVPFDLRGRSPDYRVRVGNAEGGAEVSISGLTGASAREEARP